MLDFRKRLSYELIYNTYVSQQDEGQLRRSPRSESSQTLSHCADYRAGKNFSARKWFLPILDTHTIKRAVAAKGKSAHIASALQVVFDAMIVLLSTFWRLKMLVQTRE
jgi:hypothetical protein